MASFMAWFFLLFLYVRDKLYSKFLGGFLWKKTIVLKKKKRVFL